MAKKVPHNNTDNYFSTPGLSGLLQQLVHLIQFGATTLVVEGQQGSGKSAFAQQLYSVLKSQQGQDLLSDVQLMAAEADEDIASFCSGMSSTLGIYERQDAAVGEMLADLRHYSQELIRETKLAILLLDDAHLLSDECLGAVLSLTQDGSESAYGLRLLMLANPGLATRLDKLGLHEVTLYDFDLPNFSPQELSRFLRTHGVSDYLLEDKLDHIWNRSGGFPGPALALLKHEEQEQDEKLQVGRSPWLSLPFFHVAVLATLVTVLFIVFLYRDEILPPKLTPTPIPKVLSSEPTKTAVKDAPRNVDLDVGSTDAKVEAPLVSEGDENATTDSGGAKATAETGSDKLDDSPVQRDVDTPVALGKSPAPTSAAAADLDETRSLSDSAPGDDSAQAAMEQGNSNSTDASSTRPEATGDRATKYPVIGVAGSKPKTQTPSSEQSKSDSEASELSIDADEALLSALDDDQVVLQLMAASHYDGLQKYVLAQSNRDQLKIYRRRRDDGSPLYILVIGPYSSVAEAKAMESQLPERQRKAGPWPRKARSVKSEIAAFHAH